MVQAQSPESMKLRILLYKHLQKIPGGMMLDKAVWSSPGFDKAEFSKILNIPGVPSNPAGTFGSARPVMQARVNIGLTGQDIPTDMTPREIEVAQAVCDVLVGAARWPKDDLDLTKSTSTGPVTHGKGNLELKDLFIRAWTDLGPVIANAMISGDYDFLCSKLAILNGAGVAHRIQPDTSQVLPDFSRPIGDPFVPGEVDYNGSKEEWAAAVEEATRRNVILGKRRVMEWFSGAVGASDRLVTPHALGGFLYELEDYQRRALQPHKVEPMLEAFNRLQSDDELMNLVCAVCVACRQRVAANTSLAAGLPLAALEHALFHGIVEAFPETFETANPGRIAPSIRMARIIGKDYAMLCDASNFDMTAPIAFMPMLEQALTDKFGSAMASYVMTTLAASIVQRQDERGKSGSEWLQPFDLPNHMRSIGFILSGHRLTTFLGRLFATMAVILGLDRLGQFSNLKGSDLRHAIGLFLRWKWEGPLGLIHIIDASDDIAIAVVRPGPKGTLTMDALIAACRWLLLEPSGAILGNKFVVEDPSPSAVVKAIPNLPSLVVKRLVPDRAADDPMAGKLSMGWQVIKSQYRESPFASEVISTMEWSFREIFGMGLSEMCALEPRDPKYVTKLNWHEARALMRPEGGTHGAYFAAKLRPEIYNDYFIKYPVADWSSAVRAVMTARDPKRIGRTIANNTRDMYLYGGN